MMYPVLAKVRYDRLDTVTGDRKLLVSSLLLNWVIGPALMFALAWIFLPDLPAYRTGLIIVGLARCIAMVIIWNDLACGDREAAAVLVAINSVFQVVAFAGLGWFYLSVLPGWLGLSQTHIDASTWDIARSRAHLPRHPAAGRVPLPPPRARRPGAGSWYESTFLPRIGPWALYGLLFTIVILFALQGRRHHLPARWTSPGSRCRCWSTSPSCGAAATPWAPASAWATSAPPRWRSPPPGNNFELAIAVAIATFGVTSGQALAGVVGPLIEVPVLVGLVYVSLALRKRFTPSSPITRR